MIQGAAKTSPPLLGALVRRPAEAVHLRILREANEAGFTDLVPAHLAVLRYPGPDGRRPSDLAAEVGATKQAMNYLLGQLEQLGYVERRDDPGDQRSKRVHLTERGRVLRLVIRRTVINAAQQNREPTDADVSDALNEMLSDAEALTRTLLGGEGRSLAGAIRPDDDESDDDDFYDEGPDDEDFEPEPGRAPYGWR